MPHLTKNEWVAVFVSIIAAVFFFAFGAQPIVSLFEGGLTQNQENTMSEKISSGVEAEDVLVGTGAEAMAGSLLTVHYVGTLRDGTKFDSSLDRRTPFQFVLGSGQVIRGWDEGFKGMKVGGKRRLIISPDFAYGAATGHPLQKETLIFDVELLNVTKASR